MNDNKSLSICILAAGKGTRMNSSIPKVLHELDGIPLIHHVIKTSKLLNPNQIISIIGYKKELVEESIKSFNTDVAYQLEQNGTAHAIEQCIDKIKNIGGDTLILSGDVPFISKDTLLKLILSHRNTKSLASLISAEMKDPTGYGRIIRDNSNNFKSIIEHKDATSDQLKVNEINSGIYIFNTDILCEKIHFVKNNNNQGEYYLTDIFNFIKNDQISVIKTKSIKEITGINTVDQLNDMVNHL